MKVVKIFIIVIRNYENEIRTRAERDRDPWQAPCPTQKGDRGDKTAERNARYQ